jgi:adenylate cyclase
LRLIPNIRYGTERYPEKAARRLRATNLGAWIGAAFVGFFAVWRFFEGITHWKYAALVALGLGLVPFLHRFGSIVAPLVLVAIAYTWTFWLSFNGGTASGTTFFYFTACALGILLLERALLAVVISAVAVGLLIVLHIGVTPQDVNRIPTSRLTFVVNVIGSSTTLYVIVFYAVRQFTRAEERAEREQQRSESLLANILPPSIAGRLKDRPDIAIADAYPEASILFADMAGSTAVASTVAPADLVKFLNEVFTAFDCLVERHGLEKIKTTGDGYVVVSGVPVPRSDHATALVQFALEMLDAALRIHDPHGHNLQIRIGIASGPVVAGVVGTKKFFYDVWGDAVNIASRMESTGVPVRIQISRETHQRVKDQFECESRGDIDVKGKGRMTTWLVLGRKKGVCVGQT